MKLDGTSAIVFGGAGGFGEATVRRLVAAGASAVIADLSEEKGRALADELGPATVYKTTDVTREDSVQEAVDTAVGMGPLRTAVVVHGGPTAAKRIVNRKGELYPLDTFRRTLEIFLTGTFNAMARSAQAMSRQEPTEGGTRGVVITTASIAGLEGAPGQTDYSAAKGGVVSLALTAARDLAPSAVRVVSIAPGTFYTPAFRISEEEAQDRYGHTVPNPNRMGHVDEYARLAQHIAENDYLNGTTIRIDGALRFNASPT